MFRSAGSPQQTSQLGGCASSEPSSLITCVLSPLSHPHGCNFRLQMSCIFKSHVFCCPIQTAHTQRYPDPHSLNASPPTFSAMVLSTNTPFLRLYFKLTLLPNFFLPFPPVAICGQQMMRAPSIVLN